MTNVGEIFVPIEGYQGLYEISNHGNVKTMAKTMRMPRDHGIKVFPEKLMSKVKSSNGYLRVKLSDDGKKKMCSVHRLVAMAFIPNPDNKATVNHKDGDKSNNHVSNLEWATQEENELHAKENGLKASGERHWLSKKVIDVKTGAVFVSARAAAKHYQINYFTMSDSLRGRTKTDYGLKYMVDDTV